MKNGRRPLSPKCFTRYFIFILVGLCILAGGYISYYDPLMVTGLIHTANRIVPVIDARMQKTNKLLHYQADYDALLIGSSRVEQFRQEDFAPLKVFNYAMPSIYPDEYVAYIDLFLRTNKKPVSVIYLGLDFYGSNGKKHYHSKSPLFYSGTCTSLFSAPRALFSKDSFDFAHKMATAKRDFFSYDRESLNKINEPITPVTASSFIQKQMENYSTTIYGDYVYSETYKKELQQIKARCKDTRLVIFTTPESDGLLRVLVKKGLLHDYERWLTDIVSTFGGVHNFMRPGRFTTDKGNFIDAHHLVPEKAAPIARSISGQTTNLPEEFYDNFIDSSNLKQQLERIRQDFDNPGFEADK